MERLFNLAILRAEDACYQDDQILSPLSEGLSILNLLVMRKNNPAQYPKRPYLSDEKLVRMLEEARHSIDIALSTHIKNFIRTLEIEEEEEIMKTPTVSLESVKSFFGTTQFQVNHQIGKLGLGLVEDGRYPDGEIPVDWFTDFMNRIKEDFSKAVDDFVADMCSQAEKEKGEES